jgi:hypothetical protein
MKNVVECQKDFLAYFNALETRGLLFFSRKFGTSLQESLSKDTAFGGSPFWLLLLLELCVYFEWLWLWSINTGQRNNRQRPFLQYQNLSFLFYLGWSGSFPQIKDNIMINEGCSKLNYLLAEVCLKKSGPFHWLGLVLNLFKVPGHTRDPMWSPPGR